MIISRSCPTPGACMFSLQGQGSVRPERLQCAAYGGPVIANGDGTVANWLGLHGWQPVRTAGAKRQASGYGIVFHSSWLASLVLVVGDRVSQMQTSCCAASAVKIGSTCVDGSPCLDSDVWRLSSWTLDRGWRSALQQDYPGSMLPQQIGASPKQDIIFRNLAQ